jgi:hypothetical protein
MQMDDAQFFDYWTLNREKAKTSKRAFLLGLSSGFAIGGAVLLAILSGWYPRATMEANSKMSAFVLFLAIIIIAVFIAYGYQKFKWEMMEQRYLEILARKKKNHPSMQP